MTTEAASIDRPITEENVRRYWPFLVTIGLVVGNWFVMSSKVDALTAAQATTQSDIKALSAAFYEMKGAFNERQDKKGGGN